ncbi:gag/pol protein [Cucumis melo var. makuwa]|uniref:Gag/pol protein n=1 Tax=Cucumis melo var. makuwa TaxID=1194695 RepID=A0A5D3BRI6_CUCMM|nr:gag/pol protein [Cucumis melo var. makuwa]TYK02017.1 gag/pol protein [Cucumis melo var. makuwa]
MSDVLAKKHESLATTKEIMDALRAMYGQPEWSLRHKAIKYIYTKRMKEGTSVREHVLDMIMHFNIAEVNGSVINEANQNFKKRLLPYRYGIHFSKELCPKTSQEVEDMRKIPYAFAVGSLMYAMLCTRPDICFSVGMVSRYQSNSGRDHWTAVKNILKYLRRTKYYILVYDTKDLILAGYTDFDFQTDKDARKSTSGSIVTLNGGAIVWRSVKKTCIVDSTMEVEYVAACEAAKKAIWLRKFLTDLEIVPNMHLSITLYCDNNGAVANSQEPRSHKRGKHIERKYHLIRKIVHRGDVVVTQISFEQNIADPFTISLTTKVFEDHLQNLCLRCL